MRDRGEILDYVDRKGPISHSKICDNTPMYSPDEIFEALIELEEQGDVHRFDGDIEEHGTTRTLWEATGDDGGT